jgi:MerR, DNA binding
MDVNLRIGEIARTAVAQRAGLSLDEIRDLPEIGSDPLSPRLRASAERRPPEIENLIERAQRVRGWLSAATRCECETVDECGLFDDPALPARGDAAALRSVHVGA